MAPRLPSFLPDVVVLWLVYAAVCTAVVGLTSTIAARVGSKGEAAHRRGVDAAEAFSVAVAEGDFTRAEVEATRAFGRRPTEGDAPTRRHS